jgi:hypothetical protein
MEDEIFEYAERKREVVVAMCGIIEEDSFGLLLFTGSSDLPRINDGINKCPLGFALLTMFP